MYLYGGLPKPVAFAILVLFALYLGLYHALFALVLVAARRSRLGVGGGLLLAPFFWVAVELLRGRVTGFPWDLLGYTQVNNLVVTKLAPLTGVMGISFLVVAINCGLAAGLLVKRRTAVAWGVAAALVAVVLQLLTLTHVAEKDFRPSAHAVMLQEDLSVGVTARAERPMSGEERLASFVRMSLAPQMPEPTDAATQSGAPAVARPDRPQILLWPEAPSHLQSNDPAMQQGLSELAVRAQAPVIAGTLGVDRARDLPGELAIYDSATAYQASGDYAGRYDKIHLVPWGEYVPFKEFFSFADKLTEGVGNMSRGHERGVFTLEGRRYGTFICYESIFGDEVRQFAKNGAEVLVNLSDDGWYGETGAPWQHLNMARMRAIENDRWVLRATNTGVTTAIDPLGRMAVEAPRHVRAAFSFGFGFEQATTPYTRYGDWFAYLCLALSVATVAWSLVARRTAEDR